MSPVRQLNAADRPQSLADIAYDTIRKAIVEKTFPPGHRLTEAELARQLGVSKTPVREALLRLRQIGLIEPEGARGGRVIRPSERRLEEAFEARGVLESFTARAAAERASPQQRAEIEAAARSSIDGASARDAHAFGESNRVFHLAIADAASNPQIARILDDTMALVSVIVERDTEIETSLDGGHQHLRIAQAIGSGDAQAAVDEMHEHLDRVRFYFLEGLARAARAE